MNYKELIEIGKKIFNFHPDEEFSSTEEIIEAACKALSHQYRDQGLSRYAEYLSRYCDERRNE